MTQVKDLQGSSREDRSIAVYIPTEPHGLSSGAPCKGALMARFYADIQGNRGQATRMGNKQSGLFGHIRGWNIGAKVIMEVDENDEDVCTVYLTSGSSGYKTSKLLGQFRESDLEVNK